MFRMDHDHNGTVGNATVWPLYLDIRHQNLLSGEKTTKNKSGEEQRYFDWLRTMGLPSLFLVFVHCYFNFHLNKIRKIRLKAHIAHTKDFQFQDSITISGPKELKDIFYDS